MIGISTPEHMAYPETAKLIIPKTPISANTMPNAFVLQSLPHERSNIRNRKTHNRVTLRYRDAGKAETTILFYI